MFFFSLIFKLCTEGTYEPIVFLRKPYSLTGLIVFGDIEAGQKGCPKNQSKITIKTYANTVYAAADYTNKDDEYIDENVCPRQLLKFNPPAQSKICRKEIFQNMTKINDFGIDISFENVGFSTF